MRVLKQFAGTGTFRGLPLLLLAYAALMTHFIFGRAFRDSLLGSHLAIRSLPSLTMWSTFVSIVVSLMVSNLFRSRKRKRIACAGFAVNAVIELSFSLAANRLPWLYSLFFVDVSVSTLVGLSVIWILIGDWASSCHADRSRLVPAVLLFGTATSILAGVGLTHLRTATSFRSANLILAAMNLIPVVALLFHRSDDCVSRHGFSFQDLQNRAYLPNKLLRKFAVLVVVAAMTSTLLDLMFRIRVAEQTGDTALAAQLAEKRLATEEDGGLAAALAMRVAEQAAMVGNAPRALEALSRAIGSDPGCLPARALQLDMLADSADPGAAG